VTATDTTTLVAGNEHVVATCRRADQTPAGWCMSQPGNEPRVALIAGLDHLPSPQRLRDFLIDRLYEVTNREFKSSWMGRLS
jgi:hypothetical protein